MIKKKKYMELRKDCYDQSIIDAFKKRESGGGDHLYRSGHIVHRLAGQFPDTAVAHPGIRPSGRGCDLSGAPDQEYGQSAEKFLCTSGSSMYLCRIAVTGGAEICRGHFSGDHRPVSAVPWNQGYCDGKTRFPFYNGRRIRIGHHDTHRYFADRKTVWCTEGSDGICRNRTDI